MRKKLLIKWIARLLGLVVSSAYLAIVIGEGLDGLYKNANRLIYPFLVMMAISLTGYMISWHWEKRGGVLMLAGGISMALFHVFRQDLFTAVIYGLPFMLVGILSIVGVYGEASSNNTHKQF